MSTIGAVSYLNSRPLVTGLDEAPGCRVLAEVPSRLLGGLLDGTFDIALCPIIDFQTSPVDLVLVPVGAIGSNGETLTVRLFARRPLTEVSTVHVDGDSHTSAALVQVILHALSGRLPHIATLPSDPRGRSDTQRDAILLIGDKVVASAPSRADYPFGLDLGQAWRDLTGLPFVFACWTAIARKDLGELPAVLDGQRRANLKRIPDLARPPLPPGWTEPLARRYLGQLLRYDVGPRELRAVEEFWRRCHALGLITELRELRTYPTTGQDTVSETA